MSSVNFSAFEDFFIFLYFSFTTMTTGLRSKFQFFFTICFAFYCCQLHCLLLSTFSSCFVRSCWYPENNDEENSTRHILVIRITSLLFCWFCWTVGYGDITPTSFASIPFVILQMSLSVAYSGERQEYSFLLFMVSLLFCLNSMWIAKTDEEVNSPGHSWKHSCRNSWNGSLANLCSFFLI